MIREKIIIKDQILKTQVEIISDDRLEGGDSGTKFLNGISSRNFISNETLFRRDIEMNLTTSILTCLADIKSALKEMCFVTLLQQSSASCSSSPSQQDTFFTNAETSSNSPPQ